MISSQQKDTIGWLLGAVLTAGSLGFVGHVWETGQLAPAVFQGRGPASIEAPKPAKEAKREKKDVLGRVTSQELHKHGKGSGSLSIEIASASGPLKPGAPAELEATIEALSDLDSLEFTWLFPKDVSIVSGSLEGSLGRLSKGETTSLRVTVTSGSTENRQIHLHVFRKNENGEAVGQMAQFNSVDQPKIDATIRSKAEVLGQAEAEGEALKLVQ